MTNEYAHGGNRSERGMALIMVLLLLAVVSSLATGLTMNGQVEVAMASNEATYAGARAAAEAGMNRAIAAIVANSTDDLLAGEDGLVDPDDLNAAVNADNGDIGFLLTGAPPYTIGSNDQYSYEIEIFDDDDPALYPTPLTQAQLDAMGESEGNPVINENGRLILRVTGRGPNGTTVRIGRILMVDSTTMPPPPPPNPLNPAILVNGDLTVEGNIDVMGANGSVHANGNMTTSGTSWSVEQNATASGTVTGSCSDCAGGEYGGGRPRVTVPDVHAEDYAYLATHVLQADGQVLTVADGTTCSSPCHGWSFSSGTWSISSTGTAGTFFAEGSVSISGNVKASGGGRNPLPLSVIATGSIEVSGTPILMPHNPLAMQFVTNGDLKISGNSDLEPIEVEGRSLVREQLDLHGNPKLRGQIIVQDFRDCDPCATLVTTNAIGGHVDVTYDGSFDGLDLDELPPPPATIYTHNVVGWLEGL